MFIERGFTVKESKECGAGGSMALLRWPALRRHFELLLSCTTMLQRNTSSRMLLGFACPSVQLASNLTPSRRNQDFQEVVDTIEQSFLKAMNFDFAKILVSVCFLLFSFGSRFTF